MPAKKQANSVLFALLLLKQYRSLAATRTTRSHGSQGGQATLEFALVLILLLAFILFFLQLALVLSWGNYVHYATFMAARAYLSAGPNKDDQVERATSVIARMLKKGLNNPGTDRIATVAKGVGAGNVKGLEFDLKELDLANRDLAWPEGVRYTFESKLFLIPLAGLKDKLNAKINRLNLKSESWLLRETPFNACVEDLKPKQGIFDNGC